MKIQARINWLPAIAAISLLALPATGFAKQEVWMLATSSIKGTSHSRTLFFHDKNITSLDACREEIQRGYINQWRYYNPPSGRSISAGESINFRCAYSHTTPQRWIRSAPYSFTYMVQIQQNTLNLVPQINYADCMRNTNSSQQDFCTASSQKVNL
ncbi:hypothetical protein [Thalassolituus marinus]|uniref:Uncharacterized protein n=1 Tax=Thalassolituus marinus TaxID=671053 RepID=A0ABS7ZTK2_9GAMM|nr:hypothetical protein [Thalassolituus marinus]MCA6064915.1 hypothetical protein [Thalassolituus marinus]